MESSARHLAFHASIVLLIGLLCGIPYGRSILRSAGSDIVHAWRVAHLSLPLGATLMFGVAGILTGFATPALGWAITISLVVSAYAFCFALPLAALTGHRGLSSRGPLAARLVYGGNVLGASASLVAAVALVYAGYASLGGE